MSTFASAAAALRGPVAAFRADHPEVQVELSLVEATDEAVDGVRAGRVDLALLTQPVDQPPSDLVETHRLFEDQMLVVLRAAPAGPPAALALADLAGEPWVLGGGPACSDRDTILRACHAAGFEPRVTVAFPTDDYNATQGMVAAGAGSRCCRGWPGRAPRRPGRAAPGRRGEPAGGGGRPPRRPGGGHPGHAGGRREEGRRLSGW